MGKDNCCVYAFEWVRRGGPMHRRGQTLRGTLRCRKVEVVAGVSAQYLVLILFSQLNKKQGYF